MQPTHSPQEVQSVALHVETWTMVPSGTAYLPIMTLDGQPIPVPQPQVPSKGWGGYRLVVIKRSRPALDGVRLNKAYDVETGNASGYTKVFTTMLDDLGGITDPGQHFFVLATYGMLNSFPPVPKFLHLMREAGAGPQLDEWLDSSRGIGTAYISADVNYIQAGVMNCGQGRGKEKVGVYTFPLNPKDRIQHTDILNTTIDSLGVGDSSVLVPAESQAGA